MRPIKRKAVVATDLESTVKATNNLNDTVTDVVDTLNSSIILNGNLLQEIELRTGGIDNYVSHGLGRKMLGYIIVSNTTNGVVYTSDTRNLNQDRIAILKTNANSTVNIWFF